MLAYSGAKFGMILDWLDDRLSELGNRPAAIDDAGATISYRELAIRADKLGEAIGAERKLILLEGNNSVDWLVAYVAALRGRHPVLIAPAGADETIAGLEQQFAPAIRMLARDGYRPQRNAGGGGAPLHPDLAVMLSTSGSTGSTKCVRLSRANIAANAASIAEYLEIGSDERGAVNLPTHYSYGLSIVNSHLIAGAAMLFTGKSVIDKGFWSFLGEHGATSFAGVPHIYDLLRRGDLAASAPATLRYFTQAGGRLPPDTARHFAGIAAQRGWRFYVMYGQTEATARMAYLPPEKLADHPDCVGIAIPRGRLTLADEHGAELVDADRDGELIYHGANVMMGYATSSAELADEPGPARLPTGDIARRTPDGLFRITGRQSRFVKIFGNRLGLDDVERLVSEQGHEAIATGIDDQLLVVTRDAAAAPAIAALIGDRLKLPAAYFEVRPVEQYPLLATGKIDYARLKGTIAPPANVPRAEATRPDGSGARSADAVQAGFVSVFGEAARNPAASFNSLGGDSLTYVLAVMALEDAIPRLPDEWEAMSIAQLTAVAARGGVEKGTSTDTGALVRELTVLDVVRGVCVILVVLLHVDSDHVALVAGHGFLAHAWDNIASAAKPIRMPAFFLISGFLARSAVSRPWREIAEGRFVHLLYLYLLWMALGTINNSIHDHSLGLAVNGSTILRMYVLGLVYPRSVLWFLMALIGYFILARMAQGWPRFLSMGAAAIISAFSESLPPPASYIARSLIFYMLGVYYPGMIKQILQRTSLRNAAIAAVVYVVAVVPMLRTDLTTPAIWLPAEFAGLVLMLMVARLVIDTPIGKAGMFMGQRTLPVFLLHPFLVGWWTLLVTGQGVAAPAVAALLAKPAVLAVYPALVVASAVAISLAAYRLLLSLGLVWLFELPGFLRHRIAAPVAVEPVAGLAVGMQGAAPALGSRESR